MSEQPVEKKSEADEIDRRHFRRALRLIALVLAGGCGYLLARGTGSVAWTIGGLAIACLLAAGVFALSWRWRRQLLLVLIELVLPMVLLSWWKHDWHLVFVTGGLLLPFVIAGLLLWFALRMKDRQDRKR